MSGMVLVGLNTGRGQVMNISIYGLMHLTPVTVPYLK